MAHPVSDILLLCKKTVLAKKEEVVWGGIKTTTFHPTFRINVEFGESKRKNSFTCPHCSREVKYRAYRFEFSLRRALKWVGLLIGVSIVLFLLAISLMAFGGWDVDPAMWYFGVWGVVGLIFGVGLLIVQVLRYLIFYTKNKYKYTLEISEWRSEHFMMDKKKRASWREPPS